MAAAYVDLAGFLARVPAVFGDLDADAVAVALEDAQEFVSVTIYGRKTPLAHTYYTAHLLASRFPEELASAGGSLAPGPVTSMRAGEISATFAVAASSESSLASTIWGKKFLEIAVPVELLAV